MSTFVDHYTKDLFQAVFSPAKESKPSPRFFSPSSPSSPWTQELQAILQTYRPPYNSSSPICKTLFLLQREDGSIDESNLGSEAISLRRTAIGAVVAWIYGQALDLCLQQATEADREADWWSELERSRQRLMWYFLETLPHRMRRVFGTVIDTLRARNLTVTPLSFTPYSLRRLFPATSRPSRLAVSFFPHLSTHTYIFFSSPFELCRQECRYRCHVLQQIRDNRAQRLGWLATQRDELRAALASDTGDISLMIDKIQQAIDDVVSTGNNGDQLALVAKLSNMTFNKLPQASTSHNDSISAFLRPSRLTRMWPRLFIIPPVILVLFKVTYGARWSLHEYTNRAIETVSGFWTGQLVQPFREILDTIRTGGEGVRIVSQEGVRSDTESLERMVVSLLREKVVLSPAESEVLSMQIRRGDFTSILKIYEEELKSPLKSAITGSLIRSLLIQVQKMKVDVDVALSGIDKLLKSQELTFAFVGVAPALAIVYAFIGWVKNIWYSGRGKGKHGGKGRRRAVWLSIRRIERLLTLSARSLQSGPAQRESSLTPLDQGLILLSVSQLRTYAEIYLPPRSRLREEFLVDVSDLEDPNLGRLEKREVVKRMWTSWGSVLQWSSVSET